MHSLEVIQARNAAAAVAEHQRKVKLGQDAVGALRQAGEYASDLLDDVAALIGSLQQEHQLRRLDA